MLPTQQISFLCSKFGFQCELVTDYVCRIRSKCDEWVIEYHPESSKPYWLYHIVNSPDKIVHFQRKFFDMLYLFKSVARHDRYVLNGRTLKTISKEVGMVE